VVVAKEKDSLATASKVQRVALALRFQVGHLVLDIPKDHVQEAWLEVVAFMDSTLPNSAVAGWGWQWADALLVGCVVSRTEWAMAAARQCERVPLCCPEVGLE
jgi:long-subunit fatty acid transport protein